MRTSTNQLPYARASRTATRKWRVPALFLVTTMGCAPDGADAHGSAVLAQQTAPGDERAPDAAAPPSAASLLGRYVTRLRSFWVSPTGVRAVHELGLAEFAKVGDDIVLRTRLCAQRTSLTGYQLALLAPEALPEVTRKVQTDGVSWQTDAEPIAFGYAPGGVPKCAEHAGQAVEKRVDQGWITGSTCQCPADPAAVPTLNDCRVDDLDHDQGPALTYFLTGPDGTLLRAEYYAGIVRSHAVHGVIDPQGAHRAAWKLDEAHYRLTCWPSGCDAPDGDEGPCTSDVNGLEFKPLPSVDPVGLSWTCASVRAHESILFPEPYPTAPTTCSRDAVTDPLR